MELVQILKTWEEFATIKNWKRSLKINSHRNKLSKKTEDAIRSYMPLFLEYKQKTPDEIIEEALVGKQVVKESLSDFCTWLEDVKGKKFNQSVHASYHMIRGFYSHNDINTQKIRTPVMEPSEVQISDDVLPLYDIVEVEIDGKKEKTKVLRRKLLQDFLGFLSLRDKVIIMCIKDTGADIGDVLSWKLEMIRYQEPNQDRIFMRRIRRKTREYVCYFLSNETAKLLRSYMAMNRRNAEDEEYVFVQSTKDFKTNFYNIHGRQFNPQEDELTLTPLDTHTISINCREATKELEKLLEAQGNPVKILRKNKQSPLRPKRFRKLFSDACNIAGVPTDIKRVFMGKKDPANKPYEAKSRQDLELYYERIEPHLLVFSEPQNTNEISALVKQNKNLQERINQKQEMFMEELKQNRKEIAELRWDLKVLSESKKE